MSASGEVFGGGLFGSNLGVGLGVTGGTGDTPVDVMTSGASRVAGSQQGDVTGETPLQQEERRLPAEVKAATPNIFGSGLSLGIRNAQAQMGETGLPVGPTPSEQREAPVPPNSQITPTVPANQPSGMHYNLLGMPLPPRPVGNPMQDYANQLQFQRERAQRLLNNPLAPFTNPKGYQDAATRMQQLDQQAIQFQQTIQQQKDMRDTAHNAGMSPEAMNTVGVIPTQQSILNGWTQDYSSGRFVAARALMAAGDAGKAMMEQHEGDFMPALEQNNSQADSVITRLNAASAAGQGVYEAEIAKMRQQGIDPDKVLSNYQPNFTVPDKAQQWGVANKGMMGTLAQAKQMVSQYNTRQSVIGGLSSDVADEKQAAAILKGPVAAGSRGPIEGATARNLPNGEQGGMLPMGSRIVENYMTPGGKGTWTNATPENIKEFSTQLKDDQVKGVIDKYKMAKDFSEVALDPKKYTTAAGVTVISGELGAIERDLAEKSDAAGNVGLAKMLDAKYGQVGGGLNTIAKEWSEVSGFMNRTLTKGAHVGADGQVYDANNKVIENAPRLSQSTIAGIMDIARFRKDQATANLKERIGQPMFTAGRLGISLDKSGLSKEMQQDPDIIRMANEGRQSYINDVNSHPWIAEGDQRIMLRQGTTNQSANKSVPAKSAEENNKPENQAIVAAPSRGNESPPPNGDIHAPRSGETQNDATKQLAFAATPQQRGIASNIVAPDPKAAMQQNITPNAQALLSTIRGSESNGVNANSYNLIVGGNRFTNYDGHPGQVGVVTKNGPSTAAGAYQFTKTTWNEAAQKYGPLLAHDGPNGTVSFSPQNQDKAAWLLAQDRYNAKTGGNLEQDLNDPAKHGQIMKTLSGTWTSLPGGIEPNNATASRGDALKLYQGTSLGARIARNMGSMLTPQQQREVKQTAVSALPAAGATIGATGGAAGGPVGSVVGGAAGGAAGQAFQNYLMGRDISQNVGTEAALGGVTGFIPEARPVLGAAVRTLGGAGVGGYQAAQQPGAQPSDVLLGAAKTGAAQLGGEAGMGVFTLALGKAGVMFSKFNSATQTELKGAADVVAEGKPEAPKPTVPGQPVSDAAKREYDEGVKAYDDAAQKLTDHGFDPEDAAHASRMSNQAASVPEAAAAAPVAKEKADIGKGYQQIKADVAATGVGVPKQVPLTQGPLSMVGKHPDVPKAYEGRAQQAENNISAPAANWSEKYQQLFDERSKLLDEARAASGGAAPDPNKARALNAIADNVFDHQKAAMSYIFGSRAPTAIAKLQDLHNRYRTLMQVAPDGDIIGQMAKGGTEGAAAKAAFNNYAKDDLGARQAADLLLRVKARGEGGAGGLSVGEMGKKAATMYLATHMHALGPFAFPAADMLVTKGSKLFGDWAGKRAAGAPYTFKQYLAQQVQDTLPGAQQARAAAGRVAAGATLQ
jgi:muramidase (phage lysozyme)